MKFAFAEGSAVLISLHCFEQLPPDYFFASLVIILEGVADPSFLALFLGGKVTFGSSRLMVFISRVEIQSLVFSKIIFQKLFFKAICPRITRSKQEFSANLKCHSTFSRSRSPKSQRLSPTYLTFV